MNNFCVADSARDYAGMTMAEIGTKCDGVDYAAVGMAIRRLERKLERDKVIIKQWRKVLNVLEDRVQ